MCCLMVLLPRLVHLQAFLLPDLQQTQYQGRVLQENGIQIIMLSGRLESA